MRGPGNLATILNRELAAYFNSAIAYIFMIIFALLNGGLFMTQFFLMGRLDMKALFYTLPFLLAVFLPAVSMRLWAEEKRGNTQELLLTFPMQPHELVLGKFLASFLFYLAALACTFPVPVMLAVLGRPDLGAIVGGYVGAAFLGGFFLALGTLISGFCRDQIVSFVLSMMVCFGLFLAGTEYVAASLDGWVPGVGTFLRHFLGAGDHYVAFAKGVIDNRDVVYFVLGGAVALVLNGFWIEGRMRPKAKSIFATAALICAGIFLAGNWLVSGLPLGRFDLSTSQMYTVSPATKKILRGLPTPATAKFYVSSADKMPTSMKMLEQDVRDKLEELRVASGGTFQYKVYHMDAADVMEKAEKGPDSFGEQLSKKGIMPFQVESIQSDELGVRLVYSGMTLSYKEKAEEAIARVVPGNLHELEYSIISKLYRMTLPEVPKIALAAPFEERSLDPNIMALLQQLGGGQVPPSYREDPYEFLQMGLEYEGYPVNRFSLEKEKIIPEGTKTLALLEPSALDERQKYEINRFLCQGGSVFMAVQNYEFQYKPEDDGSLLLVPEPKDPGINDLLGAWGFQVDPEVLGDAQSESINLSGGGRAALFGMTIPVKLPVQILLSDAEMNPAVSITSRLSAFFYLWGSALKVDPVKVQSQRLSVETLLTSSRQSWTVPLEATGMSPELLSQKPSSPKGPFPLAILVQGQFADAFEGKKVPALALAGEEQQSSAAAPAPQEEVAPPLDLRPGKLLLIGAATPFQKQLIRAGGHLNFFLNAIDILTLGDALIGVRSKGPVNQVLPKVSVAAKLGWRVFVMFFVPVLIAAFGFLRASWRRRSKQSYLKHLNA
ncbi:MAG: Gldg family protein [Candidatus Omnitrophica bacterium]|nr:Gldg family protein [Candidatus Omnitrophota bacterium]